MDRRRFSVAADAERRGIARARGQPPAGVSTSAEFTVTAVWITLGPGQESVEVRLAGMTTGDVVGATRASRSLKERGPFLFHERSCEAFSRY